MWEKKKMPVEKISVTCYLTLSCYMYLQSVLLMHHVFIKLLLSFFLPITITCLFQIFPLYITSADSFSNMGKYSELVLVFDCIQSCVPNNKPGTRDGRHGKLHIINVVAKSLVQLPQIEQ